jgi:putative transposase
LQRHQPYWFLKKSPGDLVGARGRLINYEQKQTVLDLITKACQSGVQKEKAAQLLGLIIRTVQRWKNKGLLDRRKGSRVVPDNKLSDYEKIRIVNILESTEFADSNPNQIVPSLQIKEFI